MTRILAVANQKGGVGKTTTSINLGAALARAGHQVLLIDLDPQGNASTGLGVTEANRKITSYDLILGQADVALASLATRIPNLKVIAANADLSSADIDLVDNDRRSFLLQKKLQDQTALDPFHYVLIDCPPSLNILTVNAMVAASAVIVPLQCEFFALEGLSQLMLTIRQVRQSANPALRIEGVVLTMYDRRNNLSQQVEADARQNLGDLVFRTVIPRNVRLSEAPSHAMSVIDYDPASAGSRAYIALAAELTARQTYGRGSND